MRAYFTLSEAQGGDPNDDPRVIECLEGFQLTYNLLRECKRGEDVAFWSGGFWVARSDGARFSDVVFD